MLWFLNEMQSEKLCKLHDMILVIVLALYKVKFSVNLYLSQATFSIKKLIWNCRLQTVSHVVHDSVC